MTRSLLSRLTVFCLLCCCLCCTTLLRAQHHLDKFLLGVPAKTTIGSSSINKLSKPVDLDFNKLPGRTHELWVLNRDNTSGSTMSVFYHVGTPQVKMEKRIDSHRGHFMINCTAFEMDGQGNFATVQEVQNTTGSGTFMGPALWTSDTAIFARMNQNDWVPGELLGSHLDMLHQSPFGMGVAHEKDNIYWVFDGYNKNLCRYDFQEPHIVGGDDHSDGKVWRYTEVSLTRKTNLPAHMIIDKKTGWLYIVDNSKKRVLRVDINSGEESIELTASNEPLESYWRMKNVKWEVFIDTGLTSPCGIDVMDNRLIVSDNSNGDIILYNTDGAKGVELGRIKTGFAGIMGVKVGPDSNIWYVNYTRNEAVQLTPDATSSVERNDGEQVVTLSSSFPNPASGTSTISFTTEAPMQATLELWNSVGVHIATLFDGTTHGEQSISTPMMGLPAGVYYYILQTPVTSIRRQFIKLPN